MNDTLAERLRRRTANAFPIGSEGSSPSGVESFCHFFFSNQTMCGCGCVRHNTMCKRREEREVLWNGQKAGWFEFESEEG